MAMTGYIDLHSHLLPGIDDGCQDVDESLQAVRRLMQAGFAGTVCTPHIWPEMFPANTPEHIDAWTADLRRQLADAGLDYPIWAGGEIRLHAKVVKDFQKHGVATLGDSRYVLVDFWEDRWPRWANKAFDWLLERQYQPILAHPERINCPNVLAKKLEELKARGVMLQGNFRCFTGIEGYWSDLLVRQFLAEGRYDFLAMDMHGPDSIEDRLDGMALAIEEFGEQRITELTRDAPRRLLGDTSAA